MSKPPIKKRRVILTVKDVSTAQKSAVEPAVLKSLILTTLDTAQELNFNDGDNSSSNSFEDIYTSTQQSSDEGGVRDDILEVPDGLQDSGEEDDTNELDLDLDSDKMNKVLRYSM